MTFDEAVKFLRETYDDPGICEVVDKATAPAIAAPDAQKAAPAGLAQARQGDRGLAEGRVAGQGSRGSWRL